ncbi:putative quinolinate synthase, chloroplastic [Cocos nucifera]|uniref:Putative quinolinate synthase, chloroplastic n=1 Tax=Cocos nucifera TaxID=13894 RepID=A0A8K0I0T7_COCNU|nr:putative quinolinate synthase, chloroplastic [Cocos nucifera]
MGVVGSTQSILDSIKNQVQEVNRNRDDHLQLVLGTESGMVTSIVAAVRGLLGTSESSSGKARIKVEIVFPVSSDSVSKMLVNGSHRLNSVIENDLAKLAVVLGVAAGEGCFIHVGCASCPYVKATKRLPEKLVHQPRLDKDILSFSNATGKYNSSCCMKQAYLCYCAFLVEKRDKFNVCEKFSQLS